MIDYNEWAANLLEEIYYTPQDQRISLLKEHLEKAHKRGYTDGAENDWWKRIEEEKKLNREEKDFERTKELYKKRHWR